MQTETKKACFKTQSTKFQDKQKTFLMDYNKTNKNHKGIHPMLFYKIVTKIKDFKVKSYHGRQDRIEIPGGSIKSKCTKSSIPSFLSCNTTDPKLDLKISGYVLSCGGRKTRKLRIFVFPNTVNYTSIQILTLFGRMALDYLY